MADRTNRKTLPEGRRQLAPPRRIPRPANDNLPPGRRRILGAAIVATVVALGMTAANLFAG